MDNDLMARRLRPPSEPAQTAPLPGPFTLPEYAEQATPSFPAWAPTPAPVEEAYQPPAADLAEAWAPAADDYATAEQVDVGDEDAPPESPFGLDAMPAQMDALAQFEMPSGFETPAELEIPARFEIPPPSEGVRYEAAASTQSPLTDDAPLEAHPTHETPPWSPQARDEVPWDRPSDFEQPTDTATPDQPSWDRPAPELWADSDYVGDPAGDVFGAVADANDDVLPYWPDAANGQAAAVASTPRVDEAPAMAATASDPDDAYAPVLGDIATPANRAWPEMNDHNAGHKNGTVGVEAIAQTADPAQAPADARGDWVDTIESFPGWSGPQPSDTDQTPEPVPTEWVLAAAEPAELAQPTPDSSPEQVPAFYADANPHPEAADAAPTTLPDSAPHAEPASIVAPDQMVMAPSQPLILRIELAIVDDSRLVVGSADAAWRVNDVNAIVLEVSQQSDVASEAEAPTPRHPAFEPRSSNGAEGADPTDANAAAAPAPAENTWLEPDFPGPSSDDAFPAASLDPPPWLDPTALAGPEPAPWDHPADPAPSVSPDSTWLAPVPPASAQPPPWTQLPLPEQSTHWPPGDFAPSGRQADVDPLSGMLTTAQASGAAAPQFAPAGHFSRVDATASRRDVAQSAFAPRVYVESELAQPAPSESAMSVQAPAVAQEQSDLWFLATENADGDAATSDGIKVAKEPSPMLTAGLTIAFAILVIVLILVFIQLMTSLLR